MIFLQAASLGFLMVVGTFGAPEQRVTSGSLKGRQDEALYSKYWANDDAVLEWEDRAGGEFAVTWDQPNGGNFVVGKGYNPGREMCVTRFLFSYAIALLSPNSDLALAAAASIIAGPSSRVSTPTPT